MLVPVVLLTGCGEPVSSFEVAEDTLENPAEQLIPREEVIRQQTIVREANRCLALIEAVMEPANTEVAAALKAHGIDLPGSETRSQLLLKATKVEQASSLTEVQINEIIEESPVRIETAQQAGILVPEIRRCIEALAPGPGALE